MFSQPLVLAAELLEFFGRRIDLGLGPAGPGREALRDAGAAFLAPMGEVGGIETLPAQQRTDGARAAGGIGGGKDFLLVGG